MWLNRLTVALRPAMSLYWSFDLLGDPEAIPNSGPLIVAPNHASFLDPWFIARVFPRHVRFLITREWYDKSPRWRWFFRANGTIPIENNPSATARVVGDALDRGECVGIFPEGRISRNGKLQRFRSGIALVAARSGAPVAPVGISGAFETFPRHAQFPKPGRIKIHLGRPRSFPNGPRPEDVDISELVHFRRAIYDDVRRLSGQAEATSGRVTPAAIVADPRRVAER